MQQNSANVTKRARSVNITGFVRNRGSPVTNLLQSVSLAAWIVPMPVMAILFTYQCFRTAGFIGPVAGTIAAAMALVMTFTILCYAAAGSPSGYVVMQKIVVAISIVWFLLLALRVSLATIEIVTVSRLEKLNQQAERYSARLQKGHRYRNPKL